jgi:hypothetical protein
MNPSTTVLASNSRFPIRARMPGSRNEVAEGARDVTA